MKVNNIILGIFLIFIPLIALVSLYFYQIIKEPFAASQGGAQIQLAAGRVYSEDDMAELLKYQKRTVVRDIIDLTEPESRPGPYPANQLIRI